MYLSGVGLQWEEKSTNIYFTTKDDIVCSQDMFK